jgi:predicted ATPase
VLTRIELELFKCFQLLKLPLAPLTLLSGANASGKSTVLQAMVLLHQTILDHEWSTRLQLNGNEIQLGTAGDVIDHVHGRYGFSIGLIDDDWSVQWKFAAAEDKQAMSVAVVSVNVDGTAVASPEKLRFLFPEPLGQSENLANRLRKLTYLTAERVGPRDSYWLQDPSAMQVVGPRGENAVGLLFQQRDRTVESKLVQPAEPPTLLMQVEARMKQFFPGTVLKLEKVPQTNSVVLGLRTSDATEFHRPVNVGFGLTQVLPIIVAALAASSGDLLLIENPEVHLHPAGQALMGQFLAEVAATGVQILTESHSDHVLNGIRRAVKAGVLGPGHVALHFFLPRADRREQVLSPVIDMKGNVDHWPDGFFDQYDKDLNYFAGWGE